MTESTRIAEQMRRMMWGGAWHGPSLMESLNGLAAGPAAAKPIPGAHSIWELVAHVDATQRLILARFRGESPGTSEADFFPPVTDTSSAAWTRAVARLKEQEEELIGVATRLSDEQLSVKNPEGMSAYESLHGHVQHNAYHAGQIRLLRKLLDA